VRADTDNREGWAGQWICLGGGGLNELAVGVQVRGLATTSIRYGTVLVVTEQSVWLAQILLSGACWYRTFMVVSGR
jgi:hypothetical protein